jgi:hypothetical protein
MDAREEAQEAKDYEGALDEALGEEPRAAELRRMMNVLLQRRAGLKEELKVIEDAKVRSRAEKDLEKLNEQIAVLREEADISEFVEDAVRVGIEMRKMSDF